MLPPHDQLFAGIDALIAWVSAFYQIAYFRSHANGKKYLRMLCAAIMIYFAVIFTSVVIDWPIAQDFGANYLRPFMWLLFFVPMWDARIDWDRSK